MRLKNAWWMWVAFSWIAIQSCQVSGEPRIEIGREYNTVRRVVADTTSRFHLNDPVFVQIFNGIQPFGRDSIELLIYSEDAPRRLISSRRFPVDAKATDVIIRGPKSNPLTARGFMQTDEPGRYLLEARIAQKVLASKVVEMYRGKK